MSKLSRKSVVELADSLTEGFLDFLNTEYKYDLDEVLANASRDYLEQELGDVDGDLAVDLQVELMNNAW